MTMDETNENIDNFIVPYEKLGKVLSDEILEKLTDYIDEILSDDESREKMKSVSLKLIRDYSVEHMAQTHLNYFDKFF